MKAYVKQNQGWDILKQGIYVSDLEFGLLKEKKHSRKGQMISLAITGEFHLLFSAMVSLCQITEVSWVYCKCL